MKTRFCSAIAVVCLAFAAPAAFAARISGDVTATVFQIYDPGNLLGGQVSMDQAGSGRFNYETDVQIAYRWSTPDGSLDVRSFAESPSQGSLAFTLGGLVFETDASSPNWMFQVDVWDAQPNTGNPDQIRLYGWPFKPVPGLPGVDGVQVTFQFADYSAYKVSGQLGDHLRLEQQQRRLLRDQAADADRATERGRRAHGVARGRAVRAAAADRPGGDAAGWHAGLGH